MSSAALPAPEDSADFGVPWHYGDPLREQRALLEGAAAVDLSHRGVVLVSGPDRLSWIHSLSTQHVQALRPSGSALDLILSPHGHVEHELHMVDDGEKLLIGVEPGQAAAVAAYLRSMQFMLRVEVDDASDRYAVVGDLNWHVDPEWPTYLAPKEFAGQGRSDAGVDKGGDAHRYVPDRPASFSARERFVERTRLRDVLGEQRAGTWAWEALRIAAGVPRFGFETDHRTLPHEVGWIGSAVHLAKGCYRGQEAVARVHNLGRPPRRLVLLHLDGSSGGLPRHGDEVLLDGRVIGWVGSAAQHYELGPIATAVVKRAIAADAVLEVLVEGVSVSAAQEAVVVA